MKKTNTNKALTIKEHNRQYTKACVAEFVAKCGKFLWKAFAWTFIASSSAFILWMTAAAITALFGLN